MKRKKTVTLVANSNETPGAKTSAWAYDVHSLAAARKCSVRSVWSHIKAKRFAPGDLMSVAQWIGHSV